MDYKQAAVDLIQRLDQRMSPSPYDIAWLARLTSPARGPRWPELTDWLLANQYPDGSWGSPISYYHDRIICSLAAALALRQNGVDGQAAVAVQRAEYYLWHHIHQLRSDPFELVGFELLFPALLAEARSMGLQVPTHAFGYASLQTAKLEMIGPELLYSTRVTIKHSLEFLGRSGDRDRLRATLASNGSLGNSPAATAYYLSLCPDDERAWQYLETVYRRRGQIPVLFPFRIYELIWVLNGLSYSGRPITEFTSPEHWQDLQMHLTPEGIGLDPSFAIPDGDLTSVAARLLIDAGYSFDPLILAHFQNKPSRLFRSYDYERNSSLSTNIHAFEALSRMPDYPDRNEVERDLLYELLASRLCESYWIDKWHASPYYATAHALIAMVNSENRYLKQAYFSTAEWMLHTQQHDGSWGFFGAGTDEETAYALTALLHFHRRHRLGAEDIDRLRRAYDYLAGRWGAHAAYPALYIGKVLYAPEDIIRAAILGALILYQDTLAG